MLVSLASESGRADGRNEDWAGATGRLAVVLDGLSEGSETGCIHGTPWFVQQLGARLFSLADSADRPLADAVALAISDVASLHSNTCDLANPGSPCTTVAMLRDCDNTLEYLVLSDSMIAFDTSPEPTIIADRSVESVAKDETSAAYAISLQDPQHFQRHQAVISAQQLVRNTPDGYWVAQSDPAAATYARSGSISSSDVRVALVLSDGAARSVVDFHELEWRDLIQAGRDSGPAAVIALTRSLEVRDPDGKQWPRYKASDDASAVVCKFH